MSYLRVNNSLSFSEILTQHSFHTNEFVEVDTEKRYALRKMNSCWRIFYTFSLRRENHIFFEHLKNFVKEQHHISDDILFIKTWDRVLLSEKISWHPQQSLNLKTLRAIDQAVRSILLYHGEGIRASSSDENDPIAKETTGYILGSSNLPFNAVNFKSLSAIFIKKDRELLNAFRKELQHTLLQSVCLFYQKKISEVLFEAFIGNVLSLLPFIYPEQGDTFQIPQKIEEKWAITEYRVDEVITLTPSWFSSPIPAFGLISENPKASPLFLFLGTTYPAGDGYVATLLSDFTPGLSVGRAPSLLGKKKIEKWLEGKKNVRAYGLSLGGATALHVGRNHKEKIESVHAFNPPGFYVWEWSQEKQPEFHIYHQKNDLVSLMGSLPTGRHVHLYEIFSGTQGKSQNPIAAHCKIYAADEKVTIFKSDARQHNRKMTTILLSGIHFMLGPIFLFIPIFFLHLAMRMFKLFIKLPVFSLSWVNVRRK